MSCEPHIVHLQAANVVDEAKALAGDLLELESRIADGYGLEVAELEPIRLHVRQILGCSRLVQHDLDELLPLDAAEKRKLRRELAGMRAVEAEAAE